MKTHSRPIINWSSNNTILLSHRLLDAWHAFHNGSFSLWHFYRVSCVCTNSIPIFEWSILLKPAENYRNNFIVGAQFEQIANDDDKRMENKIIKSFVFLLIKRSSATARRDYEWWHSLSEIFVWMFRIHRMQQQQSETHQVDRQTRSEKQKTNTTQCALE